MDPVKVIEYYNQNKSAREIAELFNTYPNKILRILKAANIELRNKSESTSTAMRSGRLKPPMKGKKRTDKEKENISKLRAKKWQEMPSEDRDKFRMAAKERWDKKTEDQKMDMQQRAGKALRKASIEGSKLEKFLNQELIKAGFNVIMHKKGLIPGDKYEVDLYLPDIPAAIEVDGPQHFKPVYGETDLRNTIRYDSTKNAILMQKGICVIRIKYLSKHNSIYINNLAFELIKKTLDSIISSPPEENERFIELEIGNEKRD